MNSRDTLATELNVLEHFNPIVPENYKDAEIVMLGNLHPAVQQSVLNQMTKKPKLAILVMFESAILKNYRPFPGFSS